MSESKVLKSAAAMGLGTFLSRIMGLVREQAFAFLFGAGNAVDAFNIAFRIPNLLRDLFAEGAMSAALVPTFTRAHDTQGPGQAWALAFRVFKVLFLSVSALSIVGILFADRLVGWYASAFRSVPGKFELAVTLTQVMFPFFPLVALAAAFMAVLNARGVFFVPAFASALFNIFSVILGVSFTWLCTKLGYEPILGMAVGVVAGGFVQAICQWPELVRKRAQELGSRPPRVDRGPLFQDRDFRNMMLLMVPGTMGLAATQVNILVNSVLATSSGPGAVSWLAYAFRLMQFPIGVFGVSLAQATLPRVSAQWVSRDYSAAFQTLERSLIQTFAVNLPAAAGLAFLSEPIIALIFQHGRFTAEDTHQTAMALAAYSVGLAAYSAVKVLVPTFYAFGNTRIPVISSVLSVALTLAFNLMSVKALGFWGLALGTSLAAYGNLLFLLFAARRIGRTHLVDWSLGRVFYRFLVHSGLALAMGGACWWTSGKIQGVFGEGVLGRAAVVGLLVTQGMAVVLGLARVFRVQETEEMLDLLQSRFLSRIRKKSS
ncbi:MAG: murein biosynthesis integral membrane protein MurJ [Bdellovibrionales bacterium]|nr:murein biosynthesis integral membrane protein MurJ [Bdellovibrionales bacterium]